MKKQEFLNLFRAELEKAAQNTETEFKIDVPRNFKIRFYPRAKSGGYLNDLYDIATAVDKLFLGEEEFHLFIDVVIEAISINRLFSIAVVMPSGRKGPFEKTWNYESGSGPFKQLISGEMLIVREENPY